MAEYIRREKQVRHQTVRSDPDDLYEPDEAYETRTTDGTSTPVSTDGQLLAARVVWYIAGILLGLLALRFLLALLGANPSNAFASFIYDITYPFVAPFFSLFGYNLTVGMAHFETYTLVAMAVYALIAYAITRLLTLNRTATSAY